MTAAENAALLRGGVILLALSAGRIAVDAFAPSTGAPAESDLPALLEESKVALDESQRRARPLEPDERIDPNTASEIELDRLPGIGPATARGIVRHREAEGAFLGPEHLMSVRGIGPSTLRRIEGSLTFSVSGTRRRASGMNSRASASSMVRLNRATAEELATLPGIGPALSERIIQFRREHGNFARVDELLTVKGIGPALLERVRSKIAIN